MSRIRSILFLMVLSVCFSSYASGANLCSLILGKAAHDKYSLSFSQPYNSFISSHSSLTPIAAKGLELSIKDKKASQLLLKAFVEKGLLEKKWEDPFYVPLFLLISNKEVQLDKKHPNPIINRWLEVGTKDLKDILNGSKKLNPLSPRERYENLRDIFLNVLTQIKDTDSNKVLNAIFTKVNELYIEKELNPQRFDKESFYRQLIKVYQAHELMGLYTFKPYSRRLGKGEQGVLYSIPFIGTTLNLIGHSETIVYERLLRNRKSIKKAGQYRDREIVPGSLQLIVRNPDFGRSKKKMDWFIKKYLNQEISNYKEFVEDANYTFPELSFVKYGSISWTKSHTPGNKKLEALLGEGTATYHRALKRLLYFFAIVRGDKQYFPKISEEDFFAIRENFKLQFFLSDKLESIENIKRFDVFLTTLMLDLLGRSSHPLLNSIDDYKSITKRHGYEFEKRSVEIIKSYPYASPHFIRHSKKDRNRILEGFEAMQHITLGQFLQLEAGPKSLEYLNQKSSLIKSDIFWRNFIGFMAIQSETRALNSGTLTAFQVKQWLLLFESSFGDRSKMDSERAYYFLVNYLNDLSNISNNFDLARITRLGKDFREFPQGKTIDKNEMNTKNLDLLKDYVVSRLFRLSRQNNPNGVELINEVLSQLDKRTKQNIFELVGQNKFQLYYASELYRQIRKSYEKNQSPDTDALGIKKWLDILSESYELAIREYRLNGIVASNPDKEVRLNFTRLIQGYQLERKDFNLYLEEIHNGFEVRYR